MPKPHPSESPSAWLAPVVQWLSWIGARLAALWRMVHAALLVLKPARFSLMMVAVGLAFLFVADQGLDTLRDFAEQKVQMRHDASQTLAFWLGAFLWAYGSWYWARVLYKIRLGDTLPDAWIVHTAKIWIPRLIGAAAIFGLAIAFYQAAAPYSPESGGPGSMLKWHAFYSLAGGIVFLLFVVFRRRLSPKLARIVERLPGGVAIARSLKEVKSVEAAKQEFGNRELRDVLHESRYLLGCSLSVAIVMFVLFAASPEWFGPRFGSAPILLLAAAGWIAFGTAADLFAMVNRFPVWIGLLAAAVAFSFINDNHAVRTLEKPVPQAWSDRQSVAQALNAWQQQQQKRPPLGADDTYPLFVVAAEGGGIRAAYWAATVLGEIQDRHPCFANQLFALSGVSGGSLGVTVFAALAADDPSRTPNLDCGLPSSFKYKVTAQAVLGEDFLAPTLAALLYPDLLQRILPFPIAHFDRARALETAWEQAWKAQTEKTKSPNANRLADPTDQLWRDPADRWMPALFLNSTVVETGRRLIASNLRLTSNEFVDVEDVHQFYAERAVPLSAAVHLSARFTFVSPAGTLEKEGRVYGRAVDGGYFEDSGATTALEILQVVDRMRHACMGRSDCFWTKVKPVMILISNDPVDRRYFGTTLAADPDQREQSLQPTPCCNEVLSPLRALLATRVARGTYARETARWHVGSDQFLHFELCKDDKVKIPLGWTLSEVVRRTMENQLQEDAKITCPIFDNRASLERVRRLLSQ